MNGERKRVIFKSSRIHIRTGYSNFWEHIVAKSHMGTFSYVRMNRRVNESLQDLNQEQGKATTWAGLKGMWEQIYKVFIIILSHES